VSQIRRIILPDFGLEQDLPRIPLPEYEERLAATAQRMRKAGLDVLAVYADREHCANIAFLTGFEPRFEEALLLLDAAGRRVLLVGNECMGYLPEAALRCQIVLYQNFSLMGQPREQSRPLRSILAEFGISKGTKVGTTGWKHFDAGSPDGAETTIEIPAYIVDVLRDLAGSERVCNGNALFMGVQDGLRIINSASQIAQFEYAAIRTSSAILALLRNLGEGVREQDLERFLLPGGLPLSCHAMISFGDKVRRGLSSPSSRAAKLGDAFTVGFGVWGALSSRAGVIARGAQDLEQPLREFYEPYVRNYFDVVAAWYEALRLGALSGEVFAAAEARRDDRLLRFAVNPGHYIHLDEWVHSPFVRDGQVELRSGMALQMDIIPVSQGPFCYSNAEDGLVLAGEPLRKELASRYPACWARIQKRRSFMTRELGIALDESVLPLGNTPAWLPPYDLNLDLALTNAKASGS